MGTFPSWRAADALPRARSEGGYSLSTDAFLVLSRCSCDFLRPQIAIAKEMGSRSGKQCRERWHNHLDPSSQSRSALSCTRTSAHISGFCSTVNKGDWTPEEDALIQQMYAQFGSKWAEMAKHLPGRPDNAIKNHFNAQKQKKDGTRRIRGDSISSISALPDLAGPDLSSPSMSRSASNASLSGSISSPRFTPYARSTSMSKSRSESISSLSAFSPLRGHSLEQFSSPSSVTSPYYSPVAGAMSRSQSSTTSEASPPTPRRGLLNGASSMPARVARNLSKQMDPSRGLYADETGTMQSIAAPNNLITPARPTYRHKHSKSTPSVPTRKHPYSHASHASHASMSRPSSPPPPLPMPPPPSLPTAPHGYGAYDSSSAPENTMYDDDLGYEQSLAHLHISDQHTAFEPFDPSQLFYDQRTSPAVSEQYQGVISPAATYTAQDAYAGIAVGMPPSETYPEFDGGFSAPYIHPSHMMSLIDGMSPFPDCDSGTAHQQLPALEQRVDEWGNVSTSTGMVHSHSSHSLHGLSQPQPQAQAGSPDGYATTTDTLLHYPDSASSSVSPQPFYNYAPAALDVMPEELLSRPALPRRGSMPVYPLYVASPLSQDSNVATAYPSLGNFSPIQAQLASPASSSSPSAVSPSLTTPSAHASSASAGSSPLTTNGSSVPTRATVRARRSKASSLSLGSASSKKRDKNLAAAIDLSLPPLPHPPPPSSSSASSLDKFASAVENASASTGGYEHAHGLAHEDDQATPRMGTFAASGSGSMTSLSSGTGMQRGYSSPGGLRIQTDVVGAGGGGVGGTRRQPTQAQGAGLLKPYRRTSAASAASTDAHSPSHTVGSPSLGSVGMSPSASWHGTAQTQAQAWSPSLSTSSPFSPSYAPREGHGHGYSYGYQHAQTPARRHPTADMMMSVDQHGRACLPGVSG